MRSVLASLLLLLTACSRSSNLAGFRETCHAQAWPTSSNGLIAVSGERLDPMGMTAGHADLPFGTIVRVVSLTGAEQVAVRIIDRVPPGAEARLRLSPRAAGQLGASGSTLLRVQVEVLP